MHAHPCSAQIHFSSIGIPISGLGYRFTLRSGKIIRGKSDTDGFSIALLNKEAAKTHSYSMIWLIHENEIGQPIALDICRDDGSWKRIGEFKLEDGKRKQFVIEANSIAFPFHLSLDHINGVK
jgi:hypothetical protein